MASALFLIGFMGAGKTTVGKKLAAKLGFDFVDLDAVIERNEQAYIRDIISDKGESYFREREAEALRQLDLTKKVVSTGGGTPCFHDNMAWIKANGYSVYLDVNEGVIFSRLKNAKQSERPLLNGLDDEGLKAFISQKLAERLPYYRRADMVFDPVKEEIESLVARVKELLH
jgi:shikimate kinase